MDLMRSWLRSGSWISLDAFGFKLSDLSLGGLTIKKILIYYQILMILRLKGLHQNPLNILPY